MEKTNGLRLWETIFNSDIEEAVLTNLDIVKDFEDMGTEEQMKPIVEALEDKNIQWVVDTYLYYNGHGLYASDLRYLLIELLGIDDIKEIEGWE